MSPQMDVAKYGSYGQYIYAAETLGSAISRGIEALDYHSTGDAMRLVVHGDEARYSYGFALAGPLRLRARGERCRGSTFERLPALPCRQLATASD